MEIVVDTEHRVIRVQIIGEYTGDQFLQAYDRISDHPDYNETYNRLWDARLATMPRGGVLDILKAIKRIPRGVNIAVLKKKPDLIMSRLAQIIIPRVISAKFQVFHDAEEADAWLRSLSTDNQETDSVNLDPAPS